jgi:hypothetical protein
MGYFNSPILIAIVLIIPQLERFYYQHNNGRKVPL